jgi:hypothetical protein
MADKQTLAVELAIIAAAREPNFVAQPTIDASSLPGPPSLATDGIEVTDAINAVVLIKLRDDVQGHAVEIQVATVDDTATYTVTLDGTPFVYAAMASDTQDEILEGLRVLIDADSRFSAGAISGTGVDAVLRVLGTSEDAYTSSVAATGTGVLEQARDAELVVFRVWGLPKNQINDETVWYRLPVEGKPGLGAAGNITTEFNWADEFRVPGFARLYVEILSTDGQVVPSIGPALLEVL